MLHKTRGITLHQIKYGDTSLIVHVYTEGFGRQSYLVKGAFNKKQAIRAAFFQPLSLLELEVYHKQQLSLQKIKEIQNIPPFVSIPFNPSKNAVSLFIAEVLYRSLKEEEPNQPLFDFLFNAIQLLDLDTSNISDFHLVFLVKLSQHLGFFPSNNYSNEFNIFDLLNGRFVNFYPSHEYYVTAPISGLLSKIIDKKLDFSEHFSLSQQNRAQLLDTLVQYYHLHVDGMGKIKSVYVLKEVFSE